MDTGLAGGGRPVFVLEVDANGPVAGVATHFFFGVKDLGDLL